jgi:hypothetical protein
VDKWEADLQAKEQQQLDLQQQQIQSKSNSATFAPKNK